MRHDPFGNAALRLSSSLTLLESLGVEYTISVPFERFAVLKKVISEWHWWAHSGQRWTKLLLPVAVEAAELFETHALLHSEEKVVFADAGYIRAEKREEIIASHSTVEFHIAEKRGRIKAMKEGAFKEAVMQLEKCKTQVRAKVEHPFHVVKNLFQHPKARCRGLRKNLAQLHTLLALTNLFIAKRSLTGGAMA